MHRRQGAASWDEGAKVSIIVKDRVWLVANYVRLYINDGRLYVKLIRPIRLSGGGPAKLEDPTTKYPKPFFKYQPQPWPGLQPIPLPDLGLLFFAYYALVQRRLSAFL